jgi:alcohol dehydrogenase class IV
MSRTMLFGTGAARRLGRVLDRFGARRVFVVTGADSYERSGARAAIAVATAGRDVVRFCGFGENPKLQDAVIGVEQLRNANCDAVVAIGGGSVLDMAKLVNVLATVPDRPHDAVTGVAPIRSRFAPLVALPTTAGSGSEATHFAVVYIDHAKYSLASPFARPDVVIVDPALTASASAGVTATSGMDALAQAIESHWSIRSTAASQAYSRRAIRLAMEWLPCAVNTPSPESRRGMSKAAHLAGRAIDITRTTAPHAVSYSLTSYFGVPHGHAVGLTLGDFLVYNSEVAADDASDARGAAYVRQSIAEIVALLGCRTPQDARERLRRFMESIGLATRLQELGLATAQVRDIVLDNINAERMSNNPRILTRDSLGGVLAAAF